jgi:hypothetical protein
MPEGREDSNRLPDVRDMIVAEEVALVLEQTVAEPNCPERAPSGLVVRTPRIGGTENPT